MTDNKVYSIPSLATGSYIRGDDADVLTTVLQKTKDLDCGILLPNINAYSIFPSEFCRLTMGKLLHTQSHFDRLVMGLMRGRMSRQAHNEII